MDFIPPNNIEAEMVVIGSCLLDNAPLKTTELIPEDFYTQKNSIVWAAMLDMLQAKEAIDLVTLTDYLRDKGTLEEIGGPSYLSDTLAGCFTSAMFKQYEAIVKDKAIRRHYITSAREIINKAVNDEPLEEIKGIYKQEFIQNTETHTAKDVIMATVKHVDKVIRHGRVGLSTGFKDIDSVVGGFVGGNLYIIGARPGMGKTAFAMNSCNKLAMDDHICGVFSMEMPEEQIGMRMISDLGDMPADWMYEAENYKHFLSSAENVIKLPTLFDFRSNLNLIQLRNKIEEMATQGKAEIIFLDYLTLIKNGSKNRNRESEVSEISRTLKVTAREFNIPIVILTQLNRGCESRPNKRPLLSDLRESGAIEQDADVVIFIYRDEMYNINTEDKGIAEFIIAKNRHGKVLIKRLAWDGHVTKFRDLQPTYQEN